MKKTFTSRGYTYRLCENELEFCDLYYGEHNTTDEYILSCVAGEFAGLKVWWGKTPEGEYYCHLSKDITEDKLYLYVLHDHLTEEFGEELTLIDTQDTAIIITENLLELKALTLINS